MAYKESALGGRCWRIFSQRTGGPYAVFTSITRKTNSSGFLEAWPTRRSLKRKNHSRRKNWLLRKLSKGFLSQKCEGPFPLQATSNPRANKGPGNTGPFFTDEPSSKKNYISALLPVLRLLLVGPEKLR